MSSRPIVWSIAGSDSGGGAGIQADIKTIHGLGCHPCTAITAITAQNTVGVQRIHRLPPDDLRAQLESLASDLPPAAVKIGMVPDKEIASVIRQVVDALDCPVVLDPVLVSTSGSSLSSDPGGEPIWQMAPRADIVCPNLHEASALLGTPIGTADEIESAAQALLQRGCRAVVIKGGHGEGVLSVDYVCDGARGCVACQYTHRHGRYARHRVYPVKCHCRRHGPRSRPDRRIGGRAHGGEPGHSRRAARQAPALGPYARASWPEAAEDLPWLTD
jgi:hydroxymethylpyrimidine kinase/phosphomethylpyrimidine kinase